MTVPSPTAVTYEYDADVRTTTGWAPLPVTDITPTIDKDRVPYAAATLTLGPVDAATLLALDPRTVTPSNGGQIRWRIRQIDPAGITLGWLPRVGDTTGDYAIMHVRSLTRTLQSVTLDVQGRERLLDDKLNLGPKEDGAIAYSNREYVNWMLAVVLDGTRPPRASDAPQRVKTADPHAAAVLDMPVWNPFTDVGSSIYSTIEVDLNAHDCRLVDAWGIDWYVATRGIPPTYTGAPEIIKLGAYTTDAANTLPGDVDPIILGLDETISRDTDWADAVIVRGEIESAGYVQTWQQLARQEHHTRGRIIDIGSDMPSSNLAESIASRTIVEGHDLTVTARARFDVLPGMTLETHLRGEILSSVITGVTWNTRQGTMTVTSQSAVTAPSIDETDQVQDTTPTARTEAATRTARLEAYVKQLPPPPDHQAEARTRMLLDNAIGTI